MADSEPAVWFVTGCSSGIGLAIAESLMSSAGRGMITARRIDVLRDLAAAAPGRIEAQAVDITNPGSVDRAVAACIARFGAIDVLVNNAGIGFLGAIEETEGDEARRVFDTNVFGTLNVIRAVLPSMRARRSGRIITVGSIAGFTASAGFGIYSGSKFALEGIHEALDIESRPFGIDISIVEPGLVATGFRRGLGVSRNTLPEYEESVGRIREGIQAEYPQGAASPASIAKAILAVARTPGPIPFRLPMGADAVARVEAKLEAVARELSLWRDFAVNAGGSADAAGIYAELAATVQRG